MDCYFHIVSISFKEGASDKKKIFSLLKNLGKSCGGSEAGILYYKTQYNIDQRKGVNLVEFAIFTDEMALDAFKSHPAHQEVLSLMVKNCDWVVSDFLGEFPAVHSMRTADSRYLEME